MDDLLADFLTETTEYIEQVENQLVAFERNPANSGAIAQIFRLVHTIKGTSSFLGLNRLQELTHVAETLITMMREGTASTQTAVTLTLKAIDRTKALVKEIGVAGVEPQGNDRDIIEAIEDYIAHGDRGAQKPLLSLHDETEQSRVVDDVLEPPISVTVQAEALKNQASHDATQAKHANETIRVSVQTIERIMELVSELVLTRNQLLELTRARASDEVKAPLQRLSTLTINLQDAVMNARMQPMTRLFASIPRLVRELSAELGKKIELVTTGANTELDRQLIELIRDPLTHLIRNCADHGIETPDQRIAAGKPPHGTITVAASHEAGQIHIEISDDGKGLDVAKIREKALSRNLVSEVKLAELNDEDVYRFILEPGFSTATHVTQVSGRGVGMDVVRSNIESIGGTVSLSSSPGLGCRFTLKIPLTLAIAPALIIAVADQRFALPQHAVMEVVSIGKKSRHSLDRVQNSLVLRLRDDVVPVIDLAQVLQLPALPSKNDRCVVIMRAGGDAFGVIVDAVNDVQEIVVKPLGSLFSNQKSFSGHTILGDGSVVLILDPSGLSSFVGVRKEAVTSDKAPEKRSDSEYMTSLILFRSGPGALKVLPLSLVSRIATVAAKDVELADGHHVFRYQNRLTPLISLQHSFDLPNRQNISVLIVTMNGEVFGLCVDEILDIIDNPMDMQIESESDGIVGTANFGDKPIEVLDVAYLLSRAHPRAQHRSTCVGKKVLLATTRPPTRDIMLSSLKAAGYAVLLASNTTEFQLALQHHEFDAILADETFRAVVKEQASQGFVSPPVLSLTAQDDEGSNRDFPTLGVLNIREAGRKKTLDVLKRALEAENPRSRDIFEMTGIRA